MLLFLLICQWRVYKIVCNFQHCFGGRSKRESSCLEIRSSARFLREIWISYFARRILEGVFVGGIVNIRNECLFFSVHGKWIAVRNKQIAWTAIFFSTVHAICFSALRFISHEPRKKDTHSWKKITFSIYTCIYISFTCCWVRLNLITSKTKRRGAHVGLCPYFWTEQVL